MKTLSKQPVLTCMWASYMQCLKAISDYLELGHSTPWIFGATGLGFIMNIHPELCPSGPTAFSQRPINALATNLGFDLYGTIFTKADKDFQAKQKEAWEMTRMAIDNDMPTFGWEMDKPEYYFIHGYDKENYLFLGFDGKVLKKKWNTLGESEIGVVSIFSANPGKKKAATSQTLKDTFTFALGFAKGDKDWMYPAYQSGLKAYTTWIEALQNGKADHFGLGYNAQVWAECKTNACEFLKEAKKKMKSKVMDNLVEHYDVISWSMQKVAVLFPFMGQEFDTEKTETAIDALFLAKEAEKAALTEMKLLLSQL
jgi:hypothetical protein